GAPIVGMRALRRSAASDGNALPYRYWLALASPWRGRALSESSAWLIERGRSAAAAPHSTELARALRDVAPDCGREEMLVEAYGWDIREGATDDCEQVIARAARDRLRGAGSSAAVTPLRVLVRAIDRGAALAPAELGRTAPSEWHACDECGVLSGADPALDPWIVAGVLLERDLAAERMQRYRREWLRDLALWEASRHQRESGISALLDASERDPHDADGARRVRRAIELLDEASTGDPPDRMPYVTATDLEHTFRGVAASLPPSSPLRARVDVFVQRLATREARPRAIALARIAVLVEEQGAPDAARALAQLARRVGSEIDEYSDARVAVLTSLRSRP
nr:hypothetical protein [Myxococcota bacterium]